MKNTIQHLSKIYQPKIYVPPGKERASYALSNSQKLFENLGLVAPNNVGTSILLPLAMRSLRKLRKIVEEELQKIDAHEILMPSLIPEGLFRKTSRHELPELFKVRDRHDKSLILAPTHEEAIVSHVANCRLSYKQLPLKLYQITSKFRDEIKPRFGLMRSREFIMKDLYCFNVCHDSAKSVYDEVNRCYHQIFKRLSVPYCCVEGSTGEIGGSMSHEFHLLAPIGEDKLYICDECKSGINMESIGSAASQACRACGGNNLTYTNGIEVGHSFLLGTRYTEPLNCNFFGSDQKAALLQMSCHGIGLTRLLAAIVEVRTSKDHIHWPTSIAPFSLCVIPPKAGSKEEAAIPNLSERFNFSQLARKYDVVFDDRTEFTIGKRLLDAKSMGYPIVIVAGKAIADSTPKVEVINADGTSELIELTEAVPYVLKKLDSLIGMSDSCSV